MANAQNSELATPSFGRHPRIDVLTSWQRSGIRPRHYRAALANDAGNFGADFKTGGDDGGSRDPTPGADFALSKLEAPSK